MFDVFGSYSKGRQCHTLGTIASPRTVIFCSTRRFRPVLVRASGSQVADTLSLIERTPFAALRHLIRLLPWRHWHWWHAGHLGKSHSLKGHHRSHRVILVEWRKSRGHHGEPWCLWRILYRRSSRVSPHPIASTASTSSTWSLESPIVWSIPALLISLEAFMERPFPAVIRAVLNTLLLVNSARR